MKKKYITPESIVIELDTTSVVCGSLEQDVVSKGNYVAEGTEYRSTLWN